MWVLIMCVGFIYYEWDFICESAKHQSVFHNIAVQSEEEPQNLKV